jgi:hypothetical protein
MEYIELFTYYRKVQWYDFVSWNMLNNIRKPILNKLTMCLSILKQETQERSILAKNVIIAKSHFTSWNKNRRYQKSVLYNQGLWVDLWH